MHFHRLIGIFFQHLDNIYPLSISFSLSLFQLPHGSLKDISFIKKTIVNFISTYERSSKFFFSVKNAGLGICVLRYICTWQVLERWCLYLWSRLSWVLHFCISVFIYSLFYLSIFTCIRKDNAATCEAGYVGYFIFVFIYLSFIYLCVPVLAELMSLTMKNTLCWIIYICIYLFILSRGNAPTCKTGYVGYFISESTYLSFDLFYLFTCRNRGNVATCEASVTTTVNLKNNVQKFGTHLGNMSNPLYLEIDSWVNFVIHRRI